MHQRAVQVNSLCCIFAFRNLSPTPVGKKQKKKKPGSSCTWVKKKNTSRLIFNDILKGTEQRSAAKALSSLTSSNVFSGLCLAQVTWVTPKPQNHLLYQQLWERSSETHFPRKRVAFDTEVQMWKPKGFCNKLTNFFSYMFKEPETIQWLSSTTFMGSSKPRISLSKPWGRRMMNQILHCIMPSGTWHCS